MKNLAANKTTTKYRRFAQQFGAKAFFRKAANNKTSLLA